MASPIIVDPTVLTERRREVFDLIVSEGLSNRELAARLCMAESTVKTHVRSLYQEFQVRTRAALIVAAARAGLVPCAACRQREVARG